MSQSMREQHLKGLVRKKTFSSAFQASGSCHASCIFNNIKIRKVRMIT